MTKNAQIKKRIFLAYFVYSVAVLLLWAFLDYGPFWHRPIYDGQTPLKWYEYVQIFNNYLIPAAIYGLFALIPLARLNKQKLAGTGFFQIAVPIGLLTVAASALVIVPLARADCGSDCGANIPQYPTLYAIIALAVIPLVAFPIYCYVQCEKRLAK